MPIHPNRHSPIGLNQDNTVQLDCVRNVIAFVRIKGMGRAGKVLKTVMENHGISQGRLAAVMGIGASNVYRWANEVRDPSSETVISLIKALKQIQPEAADEFMKLSHKDL